REARTQVPRAIPRRQRLQPSAHLRPQGRRRRLRPRAAARTTDGPGAGATPAVAPGDAARVRGRWLPRPRRGVDARHPPALPLGAREPPRRAARRAADGARRATPALAPTVPARPRAYSEHGAPGDDPPVGH